MSISFWRRLLVLWVVILLGWIFLGVLLSQPLSGTLILQAVLFSGAVALLATGIPSLLEPRLPPPTSPSPENPLEAQRLQAELFRINQELSSQAQEQSKELARLNVELQLQMAASRQAEEAALVSEERFRNMADHIQQGLTILEQGRLVYLNERACEIFGDCPKGDAFDRLLTFAASEERERIEKIIEQARITGSLPEKLEYWILSKDGQRRCIRERYTTSSSSGVDRIFILTSDITESVQAYQVLENAVSERTRELSAVLDVSQRIASTLELEPLLNLILEQIGTIIPHIGVALFLMEGEMLQAVAYRVPGLPPQDHPLLLSLERAHPYHPAVVEKQVLIIDDIHGDTPLSRAMADSVGQTGSFSFAHARSWIGIPLVVRDHVTGLLSLAHDQPGFYTQRHAHLAMTITNQVAIAIENARLYEEAQSLAVLQERNRIARELHDSATQLLYGITLYCTAASRSLRSQNLALVEQNLAEIKDNALQALQEMRLLILELDPPMLQKAGLVAALRTSLDVIESRTGLETELRTEGVDRLSRSIETEFYRIALEALNNFVRYARAKKVTVQLHKQNGWVSMEIDDNGVGFDLETARTSGGMGLRNMEQRARQIGGSFEITSSPGSGTRIRVEAPHDKPPPEAAWN